MKILRTASLGFSFTGSYKKRVYCYTKEHRKWKMKFLIMLSCLCLMGMPNVSNIKSRTLSYKNYMTNLRGCCYFFVMTVLLFRKLKWNSLEGN